MPRTPAQHLGHALGVIVAATQRLDRRVVLYGPDLDWRTNAALLQRIRAASKALGDVGDVVERIIINQRFADGSYRDETPVPGVGVVSIHRTANRKQWDHDGLAGVVLDAHLSERAGEVPDPWEVQRWLLDAAGFSYWRVGVLKSLGVDVDEFCTTEQGRRVVKIT